MEKKIIKVLMADYNIGHHDNGEFIHSKISVGSKRRFQGEEYIVKNITDAKKENPTYEGCSFLHLEKYK